MTWRIASAVLLVITVAAAVPAVRHLREAPPPPPPVLRAQLDIPRGLTLGSGAEALDAAISADSGNIAFVATRDGTTRLWLEAFASGAARPLEGTEGASLPAWRRDGQGLAFFAKGKLHSLVLGSDEITTLTDAPVPAGVAWLDDGSLVFVATEGGVVQRLANGVVSDITVLAPGDVTHAFPTLDETGRLIYVALRQNGTRVIRLLTDQDGRAQLPPYAGNRTAIDLTETAGHGELHDGVLVHVRDDVLLAQHVDETTGRLIGRSTPLATGVGHSDRGRGFFATSRRTTVWAAAVARASVLAWFDLTGQRLGVATEPGDYWQVRLSPSGRDVAVTALDPLLRTLDVMLVPLTAPGNTRRVSLAIGPDTDPVWSPDGAMVIYRSAQSGPGAIVGRPSAQSADPEAQLLRKTTDVTPSDWRGGIVLFHTRDAGDRRAIVAFDRSRMTETPVTSGGFNSWDARWSNDGQWIAYTSDESGQAEIYMQAWPAGLPRVRATFGGGQRPQWGPDGALYFRRGDALMRAMLSGTRTTPVVSTPQALLSVQGLRDFAVSPSGARVLAITSVAADQASSAHLIVNWMGDVPEAQRIRPR